MGKILYLFSSFPILGIGMVKLLDQKHSNISKKTQYTESVGDALIHSISKFELVLNSNSSQVRLSMLTTGNLQIEFRKISVLINYIYLYLGEYVVMRKID